MKVAGLAEHFRVITVNVATISDTYIAIMCLNHYLKHYVNPFNPHSSSLMITLSPFYKWIS